MSDLTIQCLALFDVESLISVDLVLKNSLWITDLADLVIVVDEVSGQ